jgi:hypothetical protein
VTTEEENIMRKIVGSSLLVGAAAVGAIAFSAPSAFAATWSVSGGTSFTGTSTSIAFRDVTTNQPFNCTGSSVSGTAANGTGLSGTGIATLGNGTFSGCTGNLGSSGTATLTAGSLNAVSYSGGVTTGTITGLAATLKINDLLGTCNATVSGEVDSVTYNNSTQKLSVAADASPKLTIVSATGSGCAGLINGGDLTTFVGSYSVSPAIQITSP